MISERLQSAINLRVSGRMEEAVQALHAIIEQPGDLDEKLAAQLSLVTAYVLQGSVPAARIVLEEASHSSSLPEIQPYVLYLDSCLLDEEGRVEELVAKLEQLLREYGNALESPEHGELREDIQQKLGYALIKLERWQEARQILEKALSFDLTAVDRSTILCNLGDCCTMTEDYEAAKKYYEGCRAMGIPKGWEARCHYYLGIAYAKLNLFREAKRELGICESNLASYGLDSKELYQWLAFVSKRLGESEKAREYKRLSLTA